MTARKSASRRSLKSDLSRVDAHSIRPKAYRELPQLTTEMLSRGKLKRGGRPVSPNPRKLITIRLPADVLARWKQPVLVGRPEWRNVSARRASAA